MRQTLKIEEIESASDRSELLSFSRHPLEAPELTLRETFYPMGFPAELRTNSMEILEQAGKLWSIYEQRHDTRPIRIDVHVIEDSDTNASGECPPAPVFRMMQPLLINMAGTDNVSVSDLEQCRTQIILARSTLQHANFLAYFFLMPAPLCHISSSYATPVHAACVALEGRGMLLCGDSGAGKSSLSYACARAGWTYVTDDATYLLHGGKNRLVTGNCHHVRFRPTAAELFPEIDGHAITPRAAGKPSIELPTASMPWITRAESARVDYLIFLNRRTDSPPGLAPYRRSVARNYMRQVLYGPPAALTAHYSTLERLLTAEIFELRYRDLDWAVDRLAALAREGR